LGNLECRNISKDFLFFLGPPAFFNKLEIFLKEVQRDFCFVVLKLFFLLVILTTNCVDATKLFIVTFKIKKTGSGRLFA